MDVRMYVMTHKKIGTIDDEMYIPLHVGKYGKDDLGYLGDNTGEHISAKNPNYCELTGMYWVWKNIQCDIVGICHYRRFFLKDNNLLTQEFIEKQLQKYDVIIPNSRCVDEKDVYDHYGNKHIRNDLDICREVIEEKYPEYIPAFDSAMRGILVSIGNMWISKKDIYDKYCEWLFDILFEVERRIDISEYDTYQSRVMGFLSERLFRVWLLMQSLKVSEVTTEQIEIEDFFNAEKKIELLYRCATLKMQPVLQMYHSGYGGSLIDPLEREEDFCGKIPVWICWWQGVEDMPEVIQCCIESLKRNLPIEKTTLRIITLDNCMQYVAFTDKIIQKFNEGKITMTHLSDILRAELLYRYGGMWIDATYYVSKKISESIFEDNSLYTLRFEKPIWQAEITQGNWSGNFWFVKKKHHKLFQFLLEGLWYYWEMEDQLIDYFLIDYVIAIAVNEFSEIREELEGCPYCSSAVFELQKYINKKYTSERKIKLMKESGFYKLNRRTTFLKENIVGEQTVYGHLLETNQIVR